MPACNKDSGYGSKKRRNSQVDSTEPEVLVRLKAPVALPNETWVIGPDGLAVQKKGRMGFFLTEEDFGDGR